jgi:hypothetical protein
VAEHALAREVRAEADAQQATVAAADRAALVLLIGAKKKWTAIICRPTSAKP